MAKVRTNGRHASVADDFWAFVEDNPKLASSIAFQVGYLAGRVTKTGSFKELQKHTPDFFSSVPHLAQVALQYLPSAAATLQPLLDPFLAHPARAPRRRTRKVKRRK